MLFTEHQPDLPSLELMIWRDSDERERRLEIIKTVSSSWQRVGTLLGQDMAELERYKTIEFNDSEKCCRRVFDSWIKEDGCPPRYPLTWRGVWSLLDHINHRHAANNLTDALQRLDCS